MAALGLQLAAAEVTQGDPVSLRVFLDPGVERVATVRLRLLVPPDGFDSVQDVVPTAFAGAGDDFAADGPTGLAGVIDVVATTGSPIASPTQLLELTARAVGLRGRRFRLRVRAVEAYDEHGVRVDVDPAQTELLVSAGQLAALPAQLPQAEVGVPYSGLLVAQGGRPPYSWAVTGGTLPGGLVLRERGAIEGTPTGTGAFSFSATVMDASASGDEDTLSFGLTVLPEPPRVTTGSLPVAVLGRAYTARLESSGGAGAPTWEAEGLPSGLHVQGGRILGTVTSDRDACGAYSAALTVREGGGAGRAATRTVDLAVLPAAPSSVPVEDPRGLAVGPNLYVTPFEVAISVSSYVPELDDETKATLEDALDDVITDIAGLLGDPELPDLPERPDRDPGGDRPVDPGGGRPVDPGDPGTIDPLPGEEPPPSPGGEPERPSKHDVLSGLLDWYRRLNDWLTETVSADAVVQVWIDGTLVRSHRPRMWSKRRRESMSPARLAVERMMLRRTAHWKRVDARLGEGAKRRELLREARRRFQRRLVEGRMQAGIHRTAGGRAGPIFFGGPGIPSGPAFDPLADLHDAIDALAEWSQRWLDDVLPPAAEDGDRLLLTPGPHRIRVAVERWTTALQHDPADAAAAAGASVVATVRIAPTNEEGWPRLAQDLVWSSGAVTDGIDQTFVADLGGSGLDVACVTPDGVQILPATGDPREPFASPRAFGCDLGQGVTGLAAGTQDEIGRSALVALRQGSPCVAVNAGVGGFQRLDVARTGDDPVGRACFGPVAADGWARVLFLTPEAVETVDGLAGVAGDGSDPPVATRTPVRSLIAGDRCVSMASVPRADGSHALALGFLTAGTVQIAGLDGNGTIGARSRLAGFDAIDHRRQVVSLGLASLLPGQRHLLLGLRQACALAPYEITAAGLARRDPASLPLRLREAVAGPGDGGGAAVLLEPNGAAAWVWWPDEGEAPMLLPLEPAGVRAIAGAGNVLALATASALRIYVRS